MHYLRSPRVLRRVLEGADSYLWVRRTGARTRRRLRGDPWMGGAWLEQATSRL
jgi:hypothetical protein